MSTTRVSRGPYAKGLRRREEILDRALEVYREVGFRNVSLRAVGESIGITHAALRHYFASTDDLLLAVLRRADDRALESFDLTGFTSPPRETPTLETPSANAVSAVAEFSRRLAGVSTEVPGLTALYSTMAARAAEVGRRDTAGRGDEADEHGTRAFFHARYVRVRGFARLVLEAGRRQGLVRDDIPLDIAAALLVAAADGLTTQWLIDPQTSIEAGLDLLDQLFRPD